MSVIPCEQNHELRRQIEEFSETLKTHSHTLGDHGLDEQEFYDSGLFRGAIERIRGQFAATMRDKREFVQEVLNHMRDRGFIIEWEPTGEAYRYDYAVTLNSGNIAAIELKGCLDGNNTNIFERPDNAQEFVIWSICTNPGADPRHNAWSGIHTRLSAEIISSRQRVDGVIIWDMVCGTIGRPCPKIHQNEHRLNNIGLGRYKLPPPCIYLMPATIPNPHNNQHPRSQNLNEVEVLAAFNKCFGGNDDEINFIDFDVWYEGNDTLRTTTIRRNGRIQRESDPTRIRR